MSWESKATVRLLYIQRIHCILTLNSQAARAQLDAKIPLEWRLDPSIISSVPRSVLSIFSQVLSTLELQITSTQDATALLNKLHEGEWTAEEVTKAFCHRAAVAHQLVRCLMDMDFEAAIARARELDVHFRQTGRTVGPLHGLPVSVKVSNRHHCRRTHRISLRTWFV
jgi:amidase